ncbi:MAG: hypothetical protein FWG34_14560 [Oscillospiraceae bacterium]|jgi:hypothetical protein|nr:hypothetical protein [Oscillospiraceae bacterium]
MYRIIPPNERKEYTHEELKKDFDGKWLYLVNSQFTDGNGLIRATPVVVADSELEGMEEGIYDQFKTSKGYGVIADADFTDWAGAFPSLFWVEDI